MRFQKFHNDIFLWAFYKHFTRIMANDFAKTKNVQLILTGRSATCRLTEEELNKLNASYYSCDINDKDGVDALIKDVINTYGKLNGIIHHVDKS